MRAWYRRGIIKNIAVFIALGLAAPFLIAATTLPEWQHTLNSQLMKEENCEVNFLSNLKVGVVNGQESVRARAHCTDNRTFDVSRTGRDKPYKIEQCGTEAC